MKNTIILAMSLVLGAGCVTDPLEDEALEDEALGDEAQEVTGHSGYVLQDTADATLDLGSASGRACYLSGVAGNITTWAFPTAGTSAGSGGAASTSTSIVAAVTAISRRLRLRRRRSLARANSRSSRLVSSCSASACGSRDCRRSRRARSPCTDASAVSSSRWLASAKARYSSRCRSASSSLPRPISSPARRRSVRRWGRRGALQHRHPAVCRVRHRRPLRARRPLPRQRLRHGVQPRPRVPQRADLLRGRMC